MYLSSNRQDVLIVGKHRRRSTTGNPESTLTSPLRLRPLTDVREPDEVALGAIPSSVSLPLSTLKKHLSSNYDAGSFVKEHMFHKPLPEQKMIFYCRSGKRSATACQEAQEAGYRNVRNYAGSWMDWRKREDESQMGNRSEDDD
jgi:rhodanese-related sulfurtransferase